MFFSLMDGQLCPAGWVEKLILPGSRNVSWAYAMPQCILQYIYRNWIHAYAYTQNLYIHTHFNTNSNKCPVSNLILILNNIKFSLMTFPSTNVFGLNLSSGVENSHVWVPDKNRERGCGDRERGGGSTAWRDLGVH